jgi:hypothetical protein
LQKYMIMQRMFICMVLECSPLDGLIIPAKVVYVRNRSNRKDYLCLISTNVNIDEEDTISAFG